MKKDSQNRYNNIIQQYRGITIPADLSESVVQKFHNKQARTYFTLPRLALSSAFAIMMVALIVVNQIGQVPVRQAISPTLSQLTDAQYWIPPGGDIHIPSLSDIGILPDLTGTPGINFSLPTTLHSPDEARLHQGYNTRHRQHT